MDCFADLMADITLTAAERMALYYFPPNQDGKVVPECFLTAADADGFPFQRNLEVDLAKAMERRGL